jgi:subtilisin family serine protease
MFAVAPVRADKLIRSQPGEQVVPDEVLVKFRPGAAADAVLADRVPNARARQVHARGLHRVRLNGRADEALMRRLADHPQVEYVEPNRIRSISIAAPNDGYFGSQWALPKVRALEAWTLVANRYPTAGTTVANRVKVAVIDTGTDCTHPDFRNAGGTSTDSAAGGQLRASLSAAPRATTKFMPACSWQDDHGHGTHVAGTIAAATHNGQGVSALGHPLEIVTFKALGHDGYGDDATIAGAIEAAAEAGARVISLSLGAAGYSQTLQDAVAYARELDALVVAAAGNLNSDALFLPAGAAGALGVAAIDSAGAKAYFSNYGSSIDVAAPGVAIFSTTPTYAAYGSAALNYGYMSGTSMATPHVSALAGLIAMATPGLSAGAIAAQLQRTADTTSSGWNQVFGYGTINAERAVAGGYGSAATGGVTGQVVDASALPALATVTIAGQTVGTDAAGLFRITGIPGGLHAVSASLFGGTPVTGYVAVVPGADAHLMLRSGAVRGVFSGTVSTTIGPIAGASVQALQGGRVIGESLTDPSGKFWVSVPPGVYELRTTAAAHAPATTPPRTVAAGGTASESLLLRRLGRVTGYVRSSSGAAVPSADVVLEGPARAGARTDSSGRYTTIGVPSGSYTVTAYSTTGQPGSTTVAVVEDMIATGNITIGTTAAGSVTVTPSTAKISGGQSVQFSAAVTGTADQAVTWSRSPAVGTISLTGLYTAPPSVTGTQNVTITATSAALPTVSATAAVTVGNFFGLTIGATTVVGGATISASSIKLDVPAPPGGVSVSLSSNNAAVSMPGTVTIPAGETSSTFAITTNPVISPVTASITATWQGITKVATLTVRPAQLSLVLLSPTSTGGGSVTTLNRVYLDGRAAAGVTVSLSSADPAKATVPATLIVPAGETSASFAITTSQVSARSPVIITASLASISKSATLTLDVVSVASVFLYPATLASGMSGTMNRVTLNGPAPPAGMVVTLASGNAAIVTTPPSVTVPAGQTSALFTTAAKPVSAAASTAISASAGGMTKSAAISVRPATLSAVTPSPAVFVGGSPPSSAHRVVLDGLASGVGVTVALTSSAPGVALPPASVLVPSGANYASFPISSTAVSAPKTVTITASAAGVAKSVSITVNPLAVSIVSVYPATLPSGKSSALNRVTLTAAAPAGGAIVQLATSDAARLTLPATVAVPAGQTSIAFTTTAGLVSSSGAVTVSATAGGVTKTATVTVRPPVLQALYLAASAIAGGSSTPTNKVILDGVAPSGGTAVALSSSAPAVASVPAAVVVPGGAGEAVFTLSTRHVGTPSPATITATAGGISKSVALTINPIVVSHVGVPSPFIGGVTYALNTVSLSGPAPAGGALVTLSSSNPAVLSVPAVVSVAAGSAISPPFSATSARVAADTTVNVSATYNGITRTASVVVAAPRLSLVLASPTSTKGGTSTTLNRVYLTGTTIVPVTVALSSTNPAVAALPASVTVPAGASSAAFTITTVPVAASTPVTVTATFAGASRTTAVTVVP